MAAEGKKVMIVNTKKGGHAFLGLYLAKRLLGKGFGVTVFNDGDPVRFSYQCGVCSVQLHRSAGVGLSLGGCTSSILTRQGRLEVSACMCT